MIQTTDHAVNKMSRLVDHIRKPESDDRETSLDLAQLCQQLVDHQGRQEPAPAYHGPTSGIEVQADPINSRTSFPTCSRTLRMPLPKTVKSASPSKQARTTGCSLFRTPDRG